MLLGVASLATLSARPTKPPDQLVVLEIDYGSLDPVISPDRGDLVTSYSTSVGNFAREVLQKGKWLGDEHIDHAQYLLGSSFPSISGFQSTIVFDSKNCVHVKVPQASFIQILNVHSNHWLTVSNFHCHSNTIKIYDSMNSQKLETFGKFNYQVAALLDCQSSSFRVEYANTKQQEGSSDCDLFAVACATSLCFGLSPETPNFNQGEMRSHLANCFLEGKLQSFPVAAPLLLSTRHSISFYDVHLCCKCRRPKVEGNSLLECIFCNNLYQECEKDTNVKLFVCTACKCAV